MKRLVSAQDVIAAKDGHEDIYIDDNTIVTAQAVDLAHEMGVCLKQGPAPHEGHEACAEQPHAEAHACHDKEEGCAPALSAEELERVIAAALDKGIWSEGDLEGLLGTNGAAHVDADVVPVGVSGRHIHLSQADLDQLFGPDFELTRIKDLSQPGQFAAKECVTIAGPKGVIEKVRVLGPVRSQTQVEVLAGDTFKLGVPQKVRLSGHLDGTPGVTVIGPKGSVCLHEGTIVAARHIHMNPAQAAERGFHDGQVVSIKADGERGGTLDNVIVRVTEGGNLDCHIDTEEANALQVKSGSTLRVIR